VKRKTFGVLWDIENTAYRGAPNLNVLRKILRERTWLINRIATDLRSYLEYLQYVPDFE